MVDTPQDAPGPQEGPAAADDWLFAPEAAPGAAHVAPEPAPGVAPDVLEAGPARPGRRGLLVGAGLVVAGVLVGASATLALGGHGSRVTTFRQAGDQRGAGQQLAPGGGAGVPGGPGGFTGGQGGLSGEQRVRGTLTAIGASTVTVRTDAGTSTYTVTGSSEIVRDGARATLAQLAVGDQVFLHVYPDAAGTTMLVERLFAGTLPAGGPGVPGGGYPPQGTV